MGKEREIKEPLDVNEFADRGDRFSEISPIQADTLTMAARRDEERLNADLAEARKGTRKKAKRVYPRDSRGRFAKKAA